MRYLLLLFLAGCASDWTARNTALEASWQVLNAIDATQTKEFQYNGLEEINPITRSILGPEPSTASTYQLFATYGLAHFLISSALPEKYRILWQAITIGPKVIVVHNNRERLE